MEENLELLKYIYHEDLYIIDEPSESIPIEPIIEKESNADTIESQPTLVQESKPVTYFGNNEKGILILVNDPSSDFINQTDLEFLMKIIESGLRYSKNDFALVNVANYPTDQVLDEISYSYLLSFGDNAYFKGDLSLYKIHEKDGKNELFADSLREISRDQAKKMQLWKTLKTMFNI